MLAAVRLQDPRAAEEHGTLPPAPTGAVRTAGGRPAGNLRPPPPTGSPQGEGHPEPPAPAGLVLADGLDLGLLCVPFLAHVCLVYGGGLVVGQPPE